MNSGSSASMDSGAQSASAAAIMVVVPDIPAFVQLTSPPVRSTTRQVCTLGQDSIALSALTLSGTFATAAHAPHRR